MTYSIDDTLNPDSAYYNGALNLPEPGNSISGLGSGEQGDQLLNVSRDQRLLSLLPSDDIQKALDRLDILGGGVVKLLAGTYVLPSDISIPSNVSVEGQGSNLTIIDCNTAYSVKMNGSNAYTTGTIAVNSGGTTVTGSGTAWTSAMVGQYIFIQMVLYQISAVGSTTSLTLADAYFGSSVSGITYAIATPNFKSRLKQLTVQNASGNGIEAQYSSEQEFSDLSVTGNGTGIYINWSYAPLIANSDIVANGTNGTLTNVSAFEIRFAGFAQSTSGDGISFNNCVSCSMYDADFSGNALNGASITNCSDINFWAISCFANGAKGIEIVSGSDTIIFSGTLVDSNISDGIKITATTTNCEFYGNTIQTNGGYGMNVAASSDSDIVISSNAFDSNTSGAVNDLGSGTVIGGNTGVVDNSLAIPFGGTGADGALTITSGVTTIDLAGAAYVVKNYTSISITGTGSLAFSNPHANGTIIVLKSVGNVTLTSSAAPMINASGCGATGATAISGSGSGSSGNQTGNTGNTGNTYSLLFGSTNAGTGGAGGGGLGQGGAIPTFALTTALYSSSQYFNRYANLWVGAGGGGGGIHHLTAAWTATGGTGGTGGGTLIIECGGAWNFTTASGISVAGKNGGDGAVTGGSVAAGGGGGGAAGYFLALYKTLTANSGTVTISGGTGGNLDTLGAQACPGGGGGGNILGAGNNGTSSSVDGAQTGANAAQGASLIAQNTFFA